jgi:PAS domain S-box-containing protein
MLTDTPRSGGTIRVLHVDDDPAKTRSVATALENRPGVADVVTETDPEEGLSRLATDDVDCLISGYDLPGTDGVAFVRTVRETHGDVPAVLFTGSGSEAAASRAISAGVTDYIRPEPDGGGLDALVERIESLADDPETTSEDRYDEAQFERFMAAFPDVVFVIDEDGRSVDLVAGGNSSLLYEDPEELIGRRFHDVYPAETADRFLDTVRQALNAEEGQRIEYQLDVQAGTRWFEARVGPLDTDGETQTVFWIARDITERKRREREYEQIFNEVDGAITVHDPATRSMVDVNETMADWTGYDRDNLLAEDIGLFSATDQGFTVDRAYDVIEQVADSGEDRTIEWKIETVDGDYRWLESRATTATIGGDQRVLGISRDITEIKRRQQEYEQIFNGVNDAIAVHDPDTGDIVEVNDTYVETFGYDRETILNRGVEGLSATDAGFTRERADDIVARVAESGESEEHEWQIETADGERRVLESTVTATTVGGERRVLTINRDVTDRRRRQRQLETIVERIDEAIYLVGVDEGRGPTFLNQAYEDLTGLSVERLQANPDVFTEHIHPDDRERYVAFLDRIEREIAADDTQDRYDIEYRFERPDGETRWHRARGYPLQDSTQYVYIGVLDDITEQKRRRREYEQIFDGVNDAIAVFDPDAGEITEVNDAYRAMFGYDLGRVKELGIEGLSASEEGYTGERGWELIREVAETGESETVEWGAETREGDRVWLEATLAPAEIGGEQRVLSIQRDITERRELKRTYRDIFEGVSDGLLIHDPETGEILEMNERYCEITGYDREELLDGSMELIMPEDPEYTYDAATERIRKAREEGPQLFEFKGERKNGEEFIGDVHLRTIEIRGNERVLASVRDITERKRRQQEYEQIFDGVKDAIAVFDPDAGEITEVNDAYRAMFGYDLDRVQELGIEGLSASEEGYTGERGWELIREVAETGESETVEWRAEPRTGDRIWLEVTMTPAEIGGNDRVLSIQRDVTERKRRQREYEQIFNGVNDAIVIQDPETAEPVDANETFLNRLGYDSTAEIREAGMEGLSASESGYTKERARELCHRVMETGEPEVVEWQQKTKDGDKRWIEAKIDSAVIRGEDRILSLQRDITERKRREQAIESLQKATERLQRAETKSEVASVAVETASEALDLPMAVCWFHDPEDDRLAPVAATDATREMGLVSGLPSDRYEYAVFEEGTVTEYTPADHGPDNPLEAGVLLPLGEHGLIAAGRRRQTGRLADESVLDIAGALAEHATTALDRVDRARELRESERRFRLIAERIDEVIYLATPDFSEVVYVNPAYESIWGRPVDELYDDARKFLAAVDPRDKGDTEAGVQAMVEEMQQGDPADSYEFEYRIRQPDGEIRWVNATGYDVEMAGGEQRFVGIVEDITERKQREQRLEVFNRILRHNLRNQLDVIRSHAETLADRTEADHAERIIAAVDELAAMGARARKTDRIMSMDTEVAAVSLPETLREAVETATPGDVDVTTDLPASVQLSTNQEALYTAVKSALENAIEHADSEVALAVEDRPDGYTVVIDDDGPGIPKEELVPIEAGTETNLRHGRGLGLWQLRWGVDTLNGELSFDTDGGTTIRITVPDCAEDQTHT